MMFLTFLLLLGFGACLDNDYASQRKLRCQLLSKDDISKLHSLRDGTAQIDLWDEDIDQLPAVITLRVNEHLVEPLSRIFMCEKPLFLPKEIGEKRYKNEAAVTPSNFFDDYRSFDDIIAWVNNLSKRSAARVMKVESLGKSGEGRNMPVVTLGKPGGANRQNFWVSGGQHAREWIAISSCLYLIEKVESEIDRFVGIGTSGSRNRVPIG
jgi:hypothetical protein